MERRLPVNLLYFGIFFSVLMLTSVGALFFRENLDGSRFFFLLYAALQGLLETLFLMCAAHLVRRFLGRWCFWGFIGATFTLLMLHLIDFFVGHILDLSIWEVIDVFVLGESMENFLHLLEASGIPMWAWILLFTGIAFLPVLGVLFYRVSERIGSLSLRWERVVQGFVCLPVALFFWDFSASRAIHPDAYTGFVQSLPWKSTFLQPETVRFPVAGQLKRPPSEKEMEQAIARDQTVLTKRPNLYLFVVESLRADAITLEGAPHLHQFQQEALQFDLTLSNANGSALSWFSIFHSQYPLFWRALQTEGWSMGSPPLRLLKKWGYKIHLYTSAQLGYYGMEELLFGKEKQLLDTYRTFHHTPSLSAAETDAAALAQMKKDLASDPALHEGQVFIIFWDATHFNYSWPKTWSPKFIPFAKEFAYFGAFFAPHKISLIRNRYRNAIHYVDALFGEFLNDLPRSEEAMVVFLGDHGEEFLEKGHLFHGSHLVKEQTEIPLFVRLGSGVAPKRGGVFSQVDLFPTLLHHLSGMEVSHFVGKSALAQERSSYGLISRFNAGQSPYEFCLHNGKHKCIARFGDRFLHIRALKDRQDRVSLEAGRNPERWLKQEFGAILEQIFDNLNNEFSRLEIQEFSE